LKSFQEVLIGWIKAGCTKKPLLLWSCKQANNRPCSSAVSSSELVDLAGFRVWFLHWVEFQFNLFIGISKFSEKIHSFR